MIMSPNLKQQTKCLQIMLILAVKVKCLKVHIKCLPADVYHKMSSIINMYTNNSFLASEDFCHLLITFPNGLGPDQTVWHSESFLKDFFQISLFWKKSVHKNKRMKKYPACKELNIITVKSTTDWELHSKRLSLWSFCTAFNMHWI